MICREGLGSGRLLLLLGRVGGERPFGSWEGFGVSLLACLFLWSRLVWGKTHPPLSAHASVQLGVCTSRRCETLKYLSRYYAAMIAACAHRPQHRASFVQVSILFTQTMSAVFGHFLFQAFIQLAIGKCVQMVCIIQAKPTTRLFQLFRCQAFQ